MFMIEFMISVTLGYAVSISVVVITFLHYANTINLSLGTYNGRDRTALAVNLHSGPNLAVCACVNGKGLALFDLRMPLPLDFVNEVEFIKPTNAHFPLGDLAHVTQSENKNSP